MQKDHPKPTSAVYVVIKRDGHTVFHRRNETGYAEKDESCMQALSRKIEEELSAALHPSEARIVHVRHRNAKDGSRLDFFYTASAWEEDIQEPETEKETYGQFTWNVSYSI